MYVAELRGGTFMNANSITLQIVNLKQFSNIRIKGGKSSPKFHVGGGGYSEP